MLLHTCAEALERRGGGSGREDRAKMETEKHEPQLPLGKSEDTSHPGLLDQL